MTQAIVKKNQKNGKTKKKKGPWLTILGKDLRRKNHLIVSIDKEVLEEIEDMILLEMIEEVQDEETMTLQELLNRLAKEDKLKD